MPLFKKQPDLLKRSDYLAALKADCLDFIQYQYFQKSAAAQALALILYDVEFQKQDKEGCWAEGASRNPSLGVGETKLKHPGDREKLLKRVGTFFMCDSMAIDRRYAYVLTLLQKARGRHSSHRA